MYYDFHFTRNSNSCILLAKVTFFFVPDVDVSYTNIITKMFSTIKVYIENKVQPITC